MSAVVVLSPFLTKLLPAQRRKKIVSYDSNSHLTLPMAALGNVKDEQLKAFILRCLEGRFESARELAFDPFLFRVPMFQVGRRRMLDQRMKRAAEN